MMTMIIAWLNNKLMLSTAQLSAGEYGSAIRALSWLGLTHLVSFTTLFIYWMRKNNVNGHLDLNAPNNKNAYRLSRRWLLPVGCKQSQR
ncbi:hypothetical protein L1D44_12210 [Shewanella sp. Isolate13]|uniref:hypothetical protein n=1 Tax=Shewanella sp. Isolate13 TaxID=2908531 RepID=UPI001EFE36FF|nr:hypothetical protein [Shewanella sp. Isolate13]MCG9730598.1 hypothetical protein [Shewanella sp. Isolate13]